MRVSIRKTVVAAVAALGMVMAATISTPAEAQFHGGGFYGGGFHGGGFHGGGWGGGWHGGGWRGGGWGLGDHGGGCARRGRDRFAAGLWRRSGLLGQAPRLDSERPLYGPAARERLLLS